MLAGMKKRAVVAVVDDDESVRESLPDLLREFGFEPRAFGSAEEFLASEGISEVDCLILDIGLPGRSGPELQRELTQRGREIPVVFITGRGEGSFPPGVLQQGSFKALFKPFDDEALRAALDEALGQGQ
jgi:FixJ family two-component response regulator